MKMKKALTQMNYYELEMILNELNEMPNPKNEIIAKIFNDLKNKIEHLMLMKSKMYHYIEFEIAK